MSKKKEKGIFAKSALLNKAGFNSTAAISATVINEYGDTPSIDLQITDCYRAISFNFSIYEEADRDNTLYKLDTLLSVLMDFRDAVSESCDKAVIAQAKREKKARKEKKAKKKAEKKANGSEQQRSITRNTNFSHD